MFIRPKFVTNSSSSSYVVYGIELKEKQLDTLIKILYKENPEKADEVSDYESLTEEEKSIITRLDCFRQWALEDEYEALTPFLPACVRLRHGESGTYWLDFDLSLDADIDEEAGVVFLVDFPIKDVARVMALAKKAGVVNTTLQLDSWVEYS